MAIDVTEAKNWIDAICTGIQTLLAIFGLLFVSYWWEQKKRKEDRKEARRKAEEETQKANAEKIIAILSENYDELEKNFQTLKKYAHDLKNKKIDTGSRTFTEFDVLLYMCHGDNWNKFDKTYLSPYRDTSLASTGYGRENVMSQVREIMNFFKKFSFELSSIDKACTNNIKLEFSTEIIEMGKTIYPFVTKTRQKLIEKVLLYFGYTRNVQEHNTSIEDQEDLVGCVRCFPCRRTVCRDISQQGPETDRLLSSQSTSHAIDIEMTLSEPRASSNVNEGLKPYLGHDEIKHAIPYIETFRYKNGEMVCDLASAFSCIKHLEICVQKKKIEQYMKVAISKELKSLWLQSCGSNLQGDLLHLIRMLMFKLSNDSTFFPKKLLTSFVDYVNSAAAVDNEVVIYRCERALQDIEFQIMHLRQEDRIKHLMEDEKTQVFLQHHAEGLRKFIMMMLNARPEQVQESRRFSSP